MRNVSFPGVSQQAKLKTHGWQCSPYLSVSYNYWRDCFGIEPFVLADWVNCWEEGANQKGSGSLNMGQKGRYCSLLYTESGLRFKELFRYCWGTLTLIEKISYAYQKEFHTGTIRSFLIGSPGSYTVTTLTGAQNLGVAELQALFTPRNSKYPYWSLSAQTELGARYQSYQGIVEVGKNF